MPIRITTKKPEDESKEPRPSGFQHLSFYQCDRTKHFFTEATDEDTSFHLDILIFTSKHYSAA